jgi:transcriptional regulator with XRE-family HTH domain
MVRMTRDDHETSIAVTGDRLTKLMKEKGLSLPELAASVRIQRSTLENFRQGHRSLPGDVLAAMADRLGTSPDFLMDRSEDPRPVEVVREEARRAHEARASAV